MTVLEDCIYSYYLNIVCNPFAYWMFLRIVFIRIIWTMLSILSTLICSWGLYLFVLFEHYFHQVHSWQVLEDCIYSYYLNGTVTETEATTFLRIVFIRIIWTKPSAPLILLNVLEDCIYSYYLNIESLVEPNLDVLEDCIYSYYLNLPQSMNWAE